MNTKRVTHLCGRFEVLVALAVLVWLVITGAAAGADAPLADAAMEEDIEAVRALLTAHADVDLAQGDGMTALHWAAFHDDLEMAALLIDQDADVRAPTRLNAITPLMLAAENGSAGMLERLLAAGADANEPTGNGTTPLMAAATAGRVDAVEVLLDRGAFVNSRENANGQTALMFAAWEDRAAVIDTLTARGAHVGLTSFITSMIEPRLDEYGNPIPPRRRRVPGGASVMGGLSALHFAARDGHEASVRALVAAGADVDQVSGGDGSSPMVIAIANGHYTVAKVLLDQGGNPRLSNLDGLTPLYATVNMRFAPVSWAPNPRTDQESVGPVELLQALLDAGADPNARIARKLWFSPTSHDRLWIDPSGATPFWRAAQSSDIESMRVLVEGGADPQLATDGGITPLMAAAGVGWIGNFSQNLPDSWMAAVSYCLETGADVNGSDTKGFTALHGAAARGDDEMVRFLVDRGADVTTVNSDGNSAADMAFGPSRFFIPKPETANLLVGLGSPFQNNCRSDQCVDGKFFGTTTDRP